jgi:hypothetical protein
LKYFGNWHVFKPPEELYVTVLECLKWKSRGWEKMSGVLLYQNLESGADAGSDGEESYMNTWGGLVVLGCVCRHGSEFRLKLGTLNLHARPDDIADLMELGETITG